MSTSIKRLYQNKTEFVPITLSEAVVVNTSNIPTLASLGITTLDKVLRTTMQLVGNNTTTISTLQTTVNNINTALANKQDKLTAGTGITIDPNGVISTSLSFELYKIVTTLPTAAESVTNTIYLKASSATAGNLFSEYICVLEPNSGRYVWEEIGTIAADVDLSGYVTNETFNNAITNINNQLANTITASNVTLSNGSTVVVVDYNIPTNLYDSMVNTDTEDEIIAG